MALGPLPFLRSSHIRLFALTLGIAAPSFALPIPKTFLESAAGHFLVFDTREGKALLKHLEIFEAGCAGPCRDRVVSALRERLAQPELSELRAKLDTRFERIQRGLAPPAQAKLGHWDRFKLKRMASRELGLEGLIGNAGAANLATRRARLLAGDRDPVLSMGRGGPPRPDDPNDALRAARWWRGRVSEMRDCVRSMPDGKLARNTLMYQLRELGLDEALVVGGKVIAAGEEPVDWNTLPSNLLFEAMSSLGGNKIAATRQGWVARWFWLTAFGMGQSTVDAVVYYFNPMTSEQTPDDKRATWERMKYNLQWDMGYSVVQPKLYDLFMGLNCLYPEGAGRAAVIGLQVGTNLGLNVLYFGLQPAVKER